MSGPALVEPSCRDADLGGRRGGAGRRVLRAVAVCLLVGGAALGGVRVGVARAQVGQRLALPPAATWLAPTTTAAPVATVVPPIVRQPPRLAPAEAPPSEWFDGTLRLRNIQPGSLGIGTAFVVGDGTWALTNRHVVEGAAALEVESWDGEPRGGAEVVALGPPSTDLALLRLDAAAPGALHLATEAVALHTAVVAGGYPEARRFTRAAGTLLAVSHEDGRTVLVTDVAAEPGSSGSPLLDPSGAVVGVVFGGSVGYTLAVPSADAVALLAAHQIAP